MAKADDIIAIATKELGVTEYPPNSNSVKYNDWYYSRSGVYGSAYPWCACFVSWVFANVDPTLIKRTASCQIMAEDFKKRGRWSNNPERGAVVFFKFSGSTRWTNHVGIVESVNADGSINTIEGNTSFDSRGSQSNGGAVAARVRRTNIVGYGLPEYDGEDKTKYYRACDKSHTSIVDALKSIGEDSGSVTRDRIAKANGVIGSSYYVNTTMLSLLKDGKLKKP